MHEEADVAGFSNGTTDLWLIATAGAHRRGLPPEADRPQPRGLPCGAAGGVDRFRREFLDARGSPRCTTPREFPEYSPGYYAVFFEDPDRLKLEVVHVPPRG